MAAALATSFMVGGAPARAQVTSEPSAVVFPDPAKFAHGFFTEGEFGVLWFTGRASDEVAPGFAVGARMGYDLFRFFAIQFHLLGSTHQTQGDTPTAGQLLQTYQGTVEGKLTLRLVQWSFFAEGGLGAARMSSNLLYVRGISDKYRTGFTVGGGAGIDYHMLSRHFSFGVRANYYVLRELTSSQDLITTMYFRYTF
jgi:opacity protein-like surface antigen